jgi:hypothetical protein
MPFAMIIAVLGLIITCTAHLLMKTAEGRSRDVYRQLVGPEYEEAVLEAAWIEGKPLVGRWGCLYMILKLLRAVGIFLIVAAAWILVISLEGS